jgi:hypothetical protein
MPAGVSAYTALANVTLGSSAATVTFSSITQVHRDLVLVVSDLKGSTLIDIRMRFNSDTGSNYSYVFAYGDGSSAGSGAFNPDNQMSLNFTTYASTTVVHNSRVNIMDYSATDKHKTVVGRADGASTATEMYAQRWASTSAITSLSVYASSGTFSSGSTFALYGVSA